MTPLEIYQKRAHEHGFNHDDKQQEVLALLGELQKQLLTQQPTRQNFWRSLKSPTKAVKGLYLWGEVGRGKTVLMDCFFAALPFEQKRRQHFHRFMLEVQSQLRQHSGTKDPLKHIAEEIADTTRVICFDEFFVEDIADAMILGTLFSNLFAQGVCLVATSNCAPDRLYSEGLLRERFLPAIDVIKKNTQVVNLNQTVDYRLQQVGNLQQGNYYTPLKHEHQRLEKHFSTISIGNIHHDPMILNQRIYPVIMRSDNVVWFNFSVICAKPASVADYIALCHTYQTVILGQVPQMNQHNDDDARRFISLVDEFYDNQITLIISAAVPIRQLYQGSRLAFAFERTKSRLFEMQSK